MQNHGFMYTFITVIIASLPHNRIHLPILLCFLPNYCLDKPPLLSSLAKIYIFHAKSWFYVYFYYCHQSTAPTHHHHIPILLCFLPNYYFDKPFSVVASGKIYIFPAKSRISVYFITIIIASLPHSHCNFPH